MNRFQCVMAAWWLTAASWGWAAIPSEFPPLPFRGETMVLLSDTVDLVPLDSGDASGAIPVWMGEQWGNAEAGPAGAQFRLDSAGMPGWVLTDSTAAVAIGCLDPGACNYTPGAEVSFPAFCEYESCLGCTDDRYEEYDPEALIDDGSCVTRRGCTDPEANNFDPLAEVSTETCRYHDILLNTWAEFPILPRDPLHFSIELEGSDAGYSEFRFFLNGELVCDNEGRFWSMLAETEDFTVHATATYEGDVLVSDTLFVEMEALIQEVPLIVDMPLIQDNWEGEGVLFFSSVDSVYLSYDEMVGGTESTILCDFTAGTEFVSGVVTGVDSVTFFSINYLEAVDSVLVDVEHTAMGFVMLSPSVSAEGEFLLNFIEETVGTLPEFPGLMAGIENDIESTGQLSLSADAFTDAETMGEALLSLIPEQAESPSLGQAACAPSGAGGNEGIVEWPVLSPNLSGKLVWKDCGSKVSYAIQARTVGLDGVSSDSKVFIYPPDLGLVGDAFFWLLAEGATTLFPNLENNAEYRFGIINNEVLTKANLSGPVDYGSAAVVVSRRGGIQNAQTGQDSEFDGLLSPGTPYGTELDAIVGMIDAVVPKVEIKPCGKAFLLNWIQTQTTILQDENLTDEQQIQQLITAFVTGLLPTFKDGVDEVIQDAVSNPDNPTTGLGGLCIPIRFKNPFKAALKIAGMVKTLGGTMLVSAGNAFYEYLQSEYGAQSYMTRHFVYGGRYWGTPVLDIGTLNHPHRFLVDDDGNLVRDSLVTTFWPTDAPYYGPVLGDPDPSAPMSNSNWIHKASALDAHRTYEVYGALDDANEYIPEINISWYPFAAYRDDGRVLHVGKPETTPLIYVPRNFKMKMGMSPLTGEFPYVYSGLGKTAETRSSDFDLVPRYGDVLFPDEYTQWPFGESPSLQSPGSCSPDQGVIIDDNFWLWSSNAVVETPLFQVDGIEPGYSIALTDNDAKSGVSKTLGVEYRPYGLLSGDWVPWPDVPDVHFQPMGLSAAVIGMPLEEYRGVWDVHANILGSFVEAAESEAMTEVLFALDEVPGRPIYRAEIGDTLFYSSCGGRDVEFRFSNVPTTSELVMEVSVEGGTVDFSSECSMFCSSEDLLPNIEEVMRLNYNLGHRPLTVSFDPEFDGTPALNVYLYARCEPDQLLGTWKVNLQPEGGASQGCGDDEVLTYWDHDYSLVEVEGQCWFAENLQTTKYRDGGAIPQPLASNWSSTTTPARTYFGIGGQNCNSSDGFVGCSSSYDEVVDAYGLLYNWYAVNTGELCPEGWKVPSEEDWSCLQGSIAGTAAFLETGAGDVLKASEGWASDGNGADVYGWKGLPGGFRSQSGGSLSAGSYGTWWSSTLAFPNAVRFALLSSSDDLVNVTSDRKTGTSIRCMKGGD